MKMNNDWENKEGENRKEGGFWGQSEKDDDEKGNILLNKGDR